MILQPLSATLPHIHTLGSPVTKRCTCSTAIQKRADSYKLQFCSLFSLSSYPRNMEATPWGFPVPIVRAASSVWAHCSRLISRGKCGALQLITYSHSEVTMGSFSEAQPRHGLMNYLPRRHLVNPRSCRGSAFWWERRLIAHPGGQTTTPFPTPTSLSFTIAVSSFGTSAPLPHTPRSVYQLLLTMAALTSSYKGCWQWRPTFILRAPGQNVILKLKDTIYLRLS